MPKGRHCEGQMAESSEWANGKKLQMAASVVSFKITLFRMEWYGLSRVLLTVPAKPYIIGYCTTFHPRFSSPLANRVSLDLTILHTMATF